jgi:hypothetical protein
LAPGFPVEPDIFVLAGGELFVSHDGGISWSTCEVRTGPDEAAVAVAAPRGIASGAPLLVGLTSGQVLRIQAA